VFTIMGLTGCSISGSSNMGKPAGDFPDYDTLASWVESNTQPFEAGAGAGAWYRAALDVQHAAAEDGYLVSAVIIGSSSDPEGYVVWCTAIAGGDLYWWFPELGNPEILIKAEALEE
jgi:hypothetical protein